MTGRINRCLFFNDTLFARHLVKLPSAAPFPPSEFQQPTEGLGQPQNGNYMASYPMEMNLQRLKASNGKTEDPSFEDIYRVCMANTVDRAATDEILSAVSGATAEALLLLFCNLWAKHLLSAGPANWLPCRTIAISAALPALFRMLEYGTLCRMSTSCRYVSELEPRSQEIDGRQGKFYKPASPSRG